MPHDPTAIRNVALVGHHGAGKTTLAEALLAATGSIARRGSVEKGSTVMDFEPEEVARQLSISTSLAPFTVNGVKVNLLDAPGYADFAGEMITALANVDLAVVIVSATDGVQAQTEDAWRAAARLGVPRVIVINKLDRERADFDRTLADIRSAFGAGVAPVELPIGHEAAFHGVIDLLDDTATHYDVPAAGAAVDGTVPPSGHEGPIPHGAGRRGAHRARTAGRGHRGRRRRPDGALPQRRDPRLHGAREEPGGRRGVGLGVPRPVLLGHERRRGRPAGPADRGAVPDAGLTTAAPGDRGDRDRRDPVGPRRRDRAHGHQDLQRRPHRQDVPLQGPLGHPPARRGAGQLAQQGGGTAARAPVHRRARHCAGDQRGRGRLRRRAPAERDADGRHAGAQGPADRGAAARPAPARALGGGQAGDTGRRRQVDVGACSACATRTRR